MSAARSRGTEASLQESIDKLSDAFDRLSERVDQISANGGGYAPTSDADRFTRHVRRYMPFYALATVWALMLLLLPTRPGGDDAADRAAGQITDAGGEAFGDVDTGDTPSGRSTRAASSGGGIAGRAPSGVETVTGPGGYVTVKGLDALAWTARGKTRGGFDCAPGVRQIPWSRYAAPCFPAWSGNNGGATSRGVTDKEIVIVDRDFPDTPASQAVDAFVQQAGFASADEFEETQHKFVNYFNKVFELWGRKVKFIEYESEYGNSTEEAQSRGKEGACSDADSIIDKHKPFLVISTSAPFGECAAARKLTVLGAGSYYPETWYRKYHPYIWAGVMECERIAHLNAEYIGKRLAHRPAKWAKRLQKDKERVFGTYVPNNDQYQHCVDIAERELEDDYDVKASEQSRYNYILDVSRFADEAAKGIVQFNADGVTTIILATEPYSTVFLTQSARSQEYWPEWITNSAGLTDVDQFARLWDQEEIQWSLFGMSQLGELSKILGPKGEGTTTYKRAFGTDIPPGTQTEYYAQMGIFSILQAMGPIVTPENMAAAYWRLPTGGAPEFEVGRTSYLTGPTGSPNDRDHTAVDDVKEIYWLCTSIGQGDARGTSRCNEPKGFDGKGGKYVTMNKGKRYLPGTFQRGDPPVFPQYPG